MVGGWGRDRFASNLPSARLPGTFLSEEGVWSGRVETFHVESEVSRKVARLSIRKDKSVRTVLVYDGNLHPIVRSNAYFDALIDIADLMKQGVCPHSYFQTMGRS